MRFFLLHLRMIYYRILVSSSIVKGSEVGKWEIVIWESLSGKKPVEKWIRELPHAHKRKIDKLLALVK